MDNNVDFSEGIVCPLPLKHADAIVISHGSGGSMTHDLIQRVFMPHLRSDELLQANDFAALALPKDAGLTGRLSISTDSHVVKPLFFPGGDIGRLAVCGTVNDVAVSGAAPLYLTAGFILEEGLPVETLEKIIISMKAAADEAGVIIVAGDTKVVEKGKADGLFINTTGLGWIPDSVDIGGANAKSGDVVLLSGPVGDHGIAVLAARGELGIETQVISDAAPLNHLIRDILAAAPHTHVLRDPTRGGVATTLNEIARQSNVTVFLDENRIPVRPAVRTACEMLGFDPLYMANEGKLIVIVPENEAEPALEAMRKNPYGEMAARIGFINTEQPGRVLLRTAYGSTRIVDMLSGELLPRIC